MVSTWQSILNIAFMCLIVYNDMYDTCYECAGKPIHPLKGQRRSGSSLLNALLDDLMNELASVRVLRKNNAHVDQMTRTVMPLTYKGAGVSNPSLGESANACFALPRKLQRLALSSHCRLVRIVVNAQMMDMKIARLRPQLCSKPQPIWTSESRYSYLDALPPSTTYIPQIIDHIFSIPVHHLRHHSPLISQAIVRHAHHYLTFIRYCCNSPLPHAIEYPARSFQFHSPALAAAFVVVPVQG